MYVGAVVLRALFALWRVYALWPYLAAGLGLWLSLHWCGVGGALSGIGVAAFLPWRPVPNASPLLAQTATALAELEDVERELEKPGAPAAWVEERESVRDWAVRNLFAAADRLLSPAARVERATEPW